MVQTATRPEIISSELWRVEPAALAVRYSEGQWRRAKHLDYISRKLADMLHKPIRLLIETPPRHGKSQLISHWLPVWIVANWPEQRVLLGTYEANFAADWGRQARDTVEANAKALGVTPNMDTWASNGWALKEGGGMHTAGVGGPFTGRGGHLIIDDPVKNVAEALSPTYREATWQWFSRVAWTRLEPGASVVCAMQRWHRDDLFGRIITNMPGEFEIIRLPAIAESGDLIGRNPGEALWPERYNTDALQKIRQNVGEDGWQSQYQQKPELVEGENYFDVAALDEMRVQGRKGEVFSPYNVTTRYGAWIDTAGEGSDNHSLSIKGQYGVAGAFVVDYTAKEPVDIFALKAYKILESYQFPMLGIESNGVGQSMLLAFKALGYPEVKYIFSDKDRIKKGVVMTANFRDFILSRLSEGLRQRQSIIYSLPAIEECFTFIKGKNGKPEAAPGCHDDRVMSMAGADWVLTQSPVNTIIDYNALQFAKV